MSTVRDRAMLPKMELIPREEREQQEIRYMGYCEKIHCRQEDIYGK